MAGFSELLSQKGVLLLDGGLGSMLQAAGLEPGVIPEMWNLQREDEVLKVHAAYAAAGCDCVTCNSFGASPAKLARYGLEAECEAINAKSAQLVRKAAPGCLVQGAVGPTGELLAPMGPAKPDEVRKGYERQIKGLMDGGADHIGLETFSDLNEALLALEAAAKLGAEATATMTFNKTLRGYFTLMGNTPCPGGRGLDQGRGPGRGGQLRPGRRADAGPGRGVYAGRPDAGDHAAQRRASPLGRRTHRIRRRRLRHRRMDRKDPGCGSAHRGRLLRHHSRAPGRHQAGGG